MGIKTKKRSSIKKPPMKISKKGYWYVNLDGRQHHLGSDREKALQLYNGLIVDSIQSEEKRWSDFSIRTLCDSFLSYAAERFDQKSGHMSNYRTAIKYLIQEYGALSISKFGPTNFKRVRRCVIQSGSSRQYANKIASRIRTIFTWGVSSEIVDPKVLIAIQSVKPIYGGETEARETEPTKPVERSVVEATITELSRVVADMVRVQLLTGMRPSEVCELCVSEIDDTDDIWVYKKHHHKNAWRGLSRTVYFGPQVKEILAPYLSAANAHGIEYLFSPCVSIEIQNADKRARRKTKVQPSQISRKKDDPQHPFGQCYTRDSYRRAITRAAQRAGVPTWSPNQLRHSAGTEIRRRYGIEAACAVLGHESISTTEIYAERNESLAKRVAIEMG